MTHKQMFKKKSLDDAAESQSAASPPQARDAEEGDQTNRKSVGNKTNKTGSAPKKGFGNVGDDDTIRLSCDLPRHLHTSIRVAAALSERSILGMTETLITVHLLDRPSDKIIADYHKSNDAK